MDDAKKGLNTQIEYRCKMYKSMHDEAERKKEKVCSLFGSESNNPFIELINMRFKNETVSGGELAYIEDIISKIKEEFNIAGLQDPFEDE